MENDVKFNDLDDEAIYHRSLGLAREESTLNFVVEFGKLDARIAFNVHGGQLKKLLDAKNDVPTATFPRQYPVRWINIWGPHRQLDIIDLLGDHYKFSPRLLAIIRSRPRETRKQDRTGETTRLPQKDDVEAGGSSAGTSRGTILPVGARFDTTHYDIATQMINYHSIDLGPRFLCVGANWMHKVPVDENNEKSATKSTADNLEHRLWSWLLLCDDNTIISLHEQASQLETLEHVEAMRLNTLSVLSQLSKFGHDSADPISMQTVRQVLGASSVDVDPGVEGASNLFYYLFDDWRSVYTTVASFRMQLEVLRKLIIEDMATEKSIKVPNTSIIPRLHMLGLHVRQMQNLYSAYKNLIDRLLEPVRAASSSHPLHLHRISSNFNAATSPRITLAPTASNRFERLSDRLSLLILSQTNEFLLEKDALTDSYFNLLARKDSEATSRLTRAAALLAKLSVLFLPVSLMTSYFSVQIADLQGKYTSTQYWNAFAGIMSISFACLFFVDKGLMLVTEKLSGWAHKGTVRIGRGFEALVERRARRGRKREEGGDT